MADETDLVLVCTCTALNHVVRFSADDRDAVVSVSLAPEQNWWKRLKTALGYLIKGNTCRYGYSAEVILSESHYPILREWLEEAEKRKVNDDQDETHK